MKNIREQGFERNIQAAAMINVFQRAVESIHYHSKKPTTLHLHSQTTQRLPDEEKNN